MRLIQNIAQKQLYNVSYEVYGILPRRVRGIKNVFCFCPIVTGESFEDAEFQTTDDIDVDESLINRVVGQDEAVKIIKKASQQRRHVLLIGEPGTGKSMLGKGLAELLPEEQLQDIVAFPNQDDENKPLIRTVPAGRGKEIAAASRDTSMGSGRGQTFFLVLLAIAAMVIPWFVLNHYTATLGNVAGAIMFASFFIGGIAFLGLFALMMNVGQRFSQESVGPKVIVDNKEKGQAPFMDATGAHAGALLGDVLHDPFQSGGLGTPAHKRVVAGMIHKANMGVLFIDEIATLGENTQQELLTALQEGEFAITGQSERSAGAMVRTEPAPCKFILVAAGNIETLRHMHPALRSRIRGYGYEVYMNETMPDTEENKYKIAQFIAQEVDKDGSIPHFTRDAVKQILQAARRRADRKGHLTLKLRDLGGLVRAAGDLALAREDDLVEPHHIESAKSLARTLEQQVADRVIDRKKEYEVIVSSGRRIGRVNGLAVMGSGGQSSGIVLPLEAEVAVGSSQDFIATGKLGEIAQEAVKNVSALVKKYFGQDIKDEYDVHVQFLQTYEGVEGDSASVAVATAIISALKDLKVKQDYAMTGSLSIRGEVLPVGGVTYKVEAAIDAGIKNVIVPAANMEDIVISDEDREKINIIPVKNLYQVLRNVIDWRGKGDVLDQIDTMSEKHEV
jgi:Lon-like ATP-dependent protease